MCRHTRRPPERVKKMSDRLANTTALNAHSLTVSSLARGVGLSRQAFARRFVTSLGESPLRFLARLRMERAAAHLGETDDGLASIAERVGYDSEYAFNRAFKRHFGMPPGRFRKSARAATEGSWAVVPSTFAPATSSVPIANDVIDLRPRARLAA